MNGSDLRELERHARDFAWNLGTVGGGYGATSRGRLASVTILDALVASGLKLVPDTDGVASAALFTRPDKVSAA